MFWKVVGVLELSLDLRVCAAVNDGASPNRKFFELHCKLVSDLGCDVVYKRYLIFLPCLASFIFLLMPAI